MSNDPPINAEWKDKHNFHQFASALKIRTDQIMAAYISGINSYAVLFHKDETNELLYLATVAKDADGILIQCGESKAQPGLWEEILDNIEKSFDD